MHNSRRPNGLGFTRASVLDFVAASLTTKDDMCAKGHWCDPDAPELR